MQRYVVSQFDNNSVVVVDIQDKREICICGNCDEVEDAEERAKKIASLLNNQDVK